MGSFMLAFVQSELSESIFDLNPFSIKVLASQNCLLNFWPSLLQHFQWCEDDNRSLNPPRKKRLPGKKPKENIIREGNSSELMFYTLAKDHARKMDQAAKTTPMASSQTSVALSR